MLRRRGGVFRCVYVQVIMLTATLPVEMELDVQKEIGFPNMRVVRLKPERLELKYQVQQLTDDAIERTWTWRLPIG